MAMASWDPFRAELFDTIRGHAQRPKLPCLVCGEPTRALSQVCLLHPIGPDAPSPLPVTASTSETAEAFSPVPPRHLTAGRVGAASGAPAPSEVSA